MALKMTSSSLHQTLLQAVFILFLNFLPAIDSSEFTPEEAMQIVDKHNELRSQVQPEAANMRYMNWDQPLASMAQQYAELCIWDHGQVENNTSSFSPIGQNLWLGGGKPTNSPSGLSATQAWYNEVRYYDYNSRKCSDGKLCGHYTQLVWAESYALGCGRNFCETAVEPSKPTRPPRTNVWIIVCNYGLAFCRQVCYNCGTLDETSCTCACQQGFIGGDCSSPCEDTHRYCGHGWYRPQCSYYQPAINKCPKMCGFCVDPDPNFNWDQPLASMAQQYAELCIWDHGQVENNTSSFSKIGQNLWLGSGKPTNMPSGTNATIAWYNEYRHYDYKTRKCAKKKLCGHYTQVVWDDSYAVGCGRIFCETAYEQSKPERRNVWIIVCNYGPSGNYNRHPYKAGPNCTKCSTNVGQCYNGLCRSCKEHNETCICRQICHNCGTLNEENCTCDCKVGFTGGDCSNSCQDRSKYCGRGWYCPQCRYYQPTIKLCPKFCGSCAKRFRPDPDLVCVEPDPKFVCDKTLDD
ncbi:uncharacterized protein LOC117124024 [Anneissia japonica]|uniref:uncharacterized protein LOC117124024 n=1 Tax=Anneissia japonica TaxID=1529436 RepID=UPI0014258DFC|nr:uncharacterized protein LOC117124024 [Anneissia japonica]